MASAAAAAASLVLTAGATRGASEVRGVKRRTRELGTRGEQERQQQERRQLRRAAATAAAATASGETWKQAAAVSVQVEGN